MIQVLQITLNLKSTDFGRADGLFRSDLFTKYSSHVNWRRGVKTLFVQTCLVYHLLFSLSWHHNSLLQRFPTKAQLIELFFGKNQIIDWQIFWQYCYDMFWITRRAPSVTCTRTLLVDCHDFIQYPTQCHHDGTTKSGQDCGSNLNINIEMISVCGQELVKKAANVSHQWMYISI